MSTLSQSLLTSTGIADRLYMLAGNQSKQSRNEGMPSALVLSFKSLIYYSRMLVPISTALLLLELSMHRPSADYFLLAFRKIHLYYFPKSGVQYSSLHQHAIPGVLQHTIKWLRFCSCKVRLVAF